MLPRGELSDKEAKHLRRVPVSARGDDLAIFIAIELMLYQPLYVVGIGILLGLFVLRG